MGSHSLTARHQRPNGPHPEGEHEKGGVRCLEWTRVPQLVQWMATLRCPLSCPHCLAVSRNSGFSDMPLVTVFGLIDQISFMGVEEFLVTGGEPLAREDLPEVIRYLGRQKVRWSLNTATLPNADARAAMEEAPPVFVAVSLDGPERIHNNFRGSDHAYEDALEAIRYYRGLPQCRVAAGTTVTSFNFDALPETFQIVVGSGAAEWGIHLPVREGRAEIRDDLFLSRNQLKQLLRFVARKRNYFPVQMADEMSYCGEWEPLVRDQPLMCGAGRTHCMVLPDGEVVPCSTLDRATSAGNVHDRPLLQIWTEGFGAIRAWQPKRRCAACDYASACEGGCWLQRRKGSSCYKDIWQMPPLSRVLRTAASVAVCLAAFQGSAIGGEPMLTEEQRLDFRRIEAAARNLRSKTLTSVQAGESLEDIVVRWYARDFPTPGSVKPLVVDASLQKDPAGVYLKALLEDRLPKDVTSLCQHVQACLKTEHTSLSLSSLLWRNLSERLLEGKQPGDRTPEERKVIRETFGMLKAKNEEWRAKILTAKLQGRSLLAKGIRVGAPMSKAGPRPRPYSVGLALDAEHERWAKLAAQKGSVENLLKLHTFAREHELQITLPPGVKWGDGASQSRTIGVLDTLTVSAIGSEKVTVNVSWDGQQLYSMTRLQLRWEVALELPSNVELSYIDVLRCAKGRVQGPSVEPLRRPTGQADLISRRGYFSVLPLNPLLLMDVRERYGGGTPEPTVEKGHVEELVARLSHEDYEVRTTAHAKLLELGPEIREMLAPHRNHVDLETRTRVNVILKKLGSKIAIPDEKLPLLTWLTDFWML